MEIWEAMERENHVAERGLVPIVNGVDVQVQHEHGGAKMDMEGFVRRGQSWYAYANKSFVYLHGMQRELLCSHV